MNVDRALSVPVFLVDDHPQVRRGLSLVLEQEGFAVCGEAESPDAMLAHPNLAAAHIVILDLSFDNADGIDFIPELCRRGIMVIVYSMHEEATIVRRALAAGAKGYITKRETALSLSIALRTVQEGAVFISPRVAEVVKEFQSEPEPSLPNSSSN